MRYRLFTPGPTQIPEATRLAASPSLIYHRGPEFKQLFLRVQDNLRYLFHTREEVLLLTCSGTGGMESCLVNLLATGQKALVIEGGKFGERWGEICTAYGIETVSLKVPWGHSPDPAEVKRILLQHSGVSAVCFTHSETSTGALTDVQAVIETVRSHSDALVIVDGITAVGVLPFQFDDWQVDVCVSGSQKGSMAPPGLAFVALSQRAWQRHESSNLPRYYFDFTKARIAAQEGNTAWTPAISVIVALSTSLEKIRAMGLENCWTHYERMATATRAGMKALGLEIFPQNPSSALTAVRVPQTVDGKSFTKTLHDKYGVTVAGGQAQLKGKIYRVAHMGDYDHLDMTAMMAAVEMALADHNWKFEWGAGLSAMQKQYNLARSGEKHDAHTDS